MQAITTIPSGQTLREAEANVPSYMRPNRVPSAVVAEGLLSVQECLDISERYNQEEPYVFGGCHAITRECPRPLEPVLHKLVEYAQVVNETYFGFDLDDEPAAWMQTYTEGDSYSMHTDGAPGQMRKLTAVLLLTDADEYSGGALWMRVEPREYYIPKHQGTIVVFPAWLPHYVEPVTKGTRQTINLGFWGPSFR